MEVHGALPSSMRGMLRFSSRCGRPIWRMISSSLSLFTGGILAISRIGDAVSLRRMPEKIQDSAARLFRLSFSLELLLSCTAFRVLWVLPVILEILSWLWRSGIAVDFGFFSTGERLGDPRQFFFSITVCQRSFTLPFRAGNGTELGAESIVPCQGSEYSA